MYKVLVTSINFGSTSKEPVEYLKNHGCEIVDNPYHGKKPSENDLLSIVGDVDAVIIGNDVFNANVLKQAPKLKVINKAGVGVDNIDIDYASELGIAVTNTPGTNVNAVADLTFGLMLAVTKRIVYTHKRITDKNMWPLDRNNDLAEKTIGIIGLGRIGKGVALRAKGFSMRILASEPNPDMDFVKNHGIEVVEIDELVKEADFITLHLPKTPSTVNIIDRRRIAMMKPSAILVNTARGGLVDEEALYDALATGRLRGAGLDVLEEEPPKSRPKLFDLDNLVITSHSGGNSLEAIEAVSWVSAQNVVDILQGRDCPNQVNKRQIKKKRY